MILDIQKIDDNLTQKVRVVYIYSLTLNLLWHNTKRLDYKKLKIYNEYNKQTKK